MMKEGMRERSLEAYIILLAIKKGIKKRRMCEKHTEGMKKTHTHTHRVHRGEQGVESH